MLGIYWVPMDYKAQLNGTVYHDDEESEHRESHLQTAAHMHSSALASASKLQQVNLHQWSTMLHWPSVKALNHYPLTVSKLQTKGTPTA